MNKFSTIIAIWLNILWLYPRSLSALPWNTEPKDLLSEETISNLQRRHGSIDNSEDLQRLIKDIGYAKPFIRLEAHQTSSGIIISGSLAKPIGDISVNSATSFIESEIEGRLQKFIGQVGAKEILLSMKEVARSRLQERGFYKSSIKISKQEGTNWNKVTRASFTQMMQHISD